MTESLALLVYTVFAATAGATALRRASWPRRDPVLGVAAWQVLSGSIVGGLLLAGLMLVVPAGFVSTSVADLLRSCFMALAAQYATPGGAIVHGAGAAFSVVLAVRIISLVAAGQKDLRRARREHLSGLLLVARRDPGLDALIVDHPAAAAYCLPGRSRTIVLTSSAVASLCDEELVAVLAHEQAHLRGRHHLVTSVSSALARAVPFVPALRWAHEEQVRLLEMIADDDAARRGGRVNVARALVRLVGSPAPAVGLGVGDVAAVARLERLLAPAVRLGRARRVLLAAAVGLAALAPIGIAATPAVAASRVERCPLTSAHVMTRMDPRCLAMMSRSGLPTSPLWVDKAPADPVIGGR